VPLHIQKGFHISCKQKKDRDELEGAKKNIAANATFVRGGQTGMKQQSNLKNYPRKKTSKDLIYPNIKNEVKANHKHIDIVFMNGLGANYYIAEEDAEFIHKIDDGKKYNENISYFRTRIFKREKSRFIEILKESNKGYVFMDMIRGTDPIMRVVVDSSDNNLIGKKF
jgi:hypothetical protein